MKCTTARNPPPPIPDRPSPGLPRTALLDLIFRRQSGKSARKKKTTTDNCTMEGQHSLEREGAGRPERRTAVVAMELAKFDIDIAALCETRFSESLVVSTSWNTLSSGVAGK